MKEILNELTQLRDSKNKNKRVFNKGKVSAKILKQCANYIKTNNEQKRIEALCKICIHCINALYCLGYEDERAFRVPQSFGNITFIIEDTGRYLSEDINKSKDFNVEKILYFYRTAYKRIMQLGYEPNVCIKEVLKKGD